MVFIDIVEMAEVIQVILPVFKIQVQLFLYCDG